MLENIAKKGARGKSSTCLAHIELKGIPGVSLPRNNLYSRKKLSECFKNDHRSSSLPKISFKGRLWVIFRAFGASLWRPSAPTMAPMNRLWDALVLVGWGPRAPRDAPEHKLKKVKKKTLLGVQNAVSYTHLTLPTKRIV